MNKLAHYRLVKVAADEDKNFINKIVEEFSKLDPEEQAALVGGAGGATYGAFQEGEGLGDRLINTLGYGAAGTGAGYGLGSLYQMYQDRLVDQQKEQLRQEEATTMPRQGQGYRVRGQDEYDNPPSVDEIDRMHPHNNPRQPGDFDHPANTYGMYGAKWKHLDPEKYPNHPANAPSVDEIRRMNPSHPSNAPSVDEIRRMDPSHPANAPSYEELKSMGLV